MEGEEEDEGKVEEMVQKMRASAGSASDGSDFGEGNSNSLIFCKKGKQTK